MIAVLPDRVGPVTSGCGASERTDQRRMAPTTASPATWLQLSSPALDRRAGHAPAPERGLRQASIAVPVRLVDPEHPVGDALQVITPACCHDTLVLSYGHMS